jgi:hypothetical protein
MRPQSATSHFSPLTSYLLLLLLLRVPRGKRYPRGRLAVEADLERVLPGVRQRHVEHEYGAGLHVDNSRRRLTELYRALTA